MVSRSVDYDYIKHASDQNKYIIIDVREPKELEDTGIIPNSINIPLASLENVFKSMPNEEFKKKFDKEKPGKDAIIILTCRSGNRSGQAQKLLEGFGYVQVKNYSGGWLDWEKHLV